MKTCLFTLLFVFLLPFCVSAQNQPVPNGGFEVWDSINPQGWETNNNDVILPPFTTVVVLKDTLNPYQGSNAMYLIYNWTYPAWASTSFENAGHPSALDAYVRCNVFSGDTVSIRIETLNNGAVVDTGYWEGLESINAWTKISIPVTQSVVEVFETRITITGGRRSGPADETSTLWVDSLSLDYSPMQIADIVLAQNDIDVFPNPCVETIHLKSKRPDLKIESFSLYTSSGVNIYDAKATSLDIRPLHIPQGTYYLLIQTNKGRMTKQLIWQGEND